MKNIYTVTVDGVQYQYPAGTSYQQIAREMQSAYSSDILLVERNGKLCELEKKLDRDCTLKMITGRDRPGAQTYERSAIFLMLKAFYDIVGEARIECICVEYSLSHALFVTAKDAAISSTEVRKRLEQHSDIAGLVDEEVEKLL